MNVRDRISDLMQVVRNYQQKHVELLKSHHFVAAVPLRPDGVEFDYLVVGLNPGEQDSNWTAFPRTTEETIDFNWLESLPGGPTRQAKAWRKKVAQFCGTDQVLQSDFFFWSTNNVGKAFTERFGTPFHKSKHLEFCRDINLKLVELTKPKAVVCPGISHAESFARLYGLEPVNFVPTPSGGKLIAHYERSGMPWVFSKHWGGAFGFTKEQRATVASYIKGLDDRG
jgi:hypothetical protein